MFSPGPTRSNCSAIPRAQSQVHPSIIGRIKWLLAALACAWALVFGLGGGVQTDAIEHPHQSVVIEKHTCALGTLTADLQESAHECEADLTVAQALPMQPSVGQPWDLHPASRAFKPPPPLPPPRLRA